MVKNIILAGVGGQGILTIATIIDHAAILNNLFIKQAEVHGMSQRGGAVQSHLRISDSEIFSDLISLGMADIIISLEPMEALRYIPFLSPKGIIITATKPFVNVTNYPEEHKIIDEIKNLGVKYLFVDIDDLAKKTGSSRTGNVVMVGAAAQYLDIPQQLIEESIRQLFTAKGETILQQNIEAFKLGLKA